MYTLMLAKERSRRRSRCSPSLRYEYLEHMFHTIRYTFSSDSPYGARSFNPALSRSRRFATVIAELQFPPCWLPGTAQKKARLANGKFTRRLPGSFSSRRQTYGKCVQAFLHVETSSYPPPLQHY